MTIKFERVNMSGPWTRNNEDLTHYRFWDEDKPNTMFFYIPKEQFEPLFKDMAKELGYMIIGRHGAIINTKNMNEEEKTKYKEAYEDLQAVQKVIRYKENTPKVDKWDKIEKILNESDNLYDFDNFVSRCQEYADKEFLKNPIIRDEDKNKILNMDKYAKSEQQHKLELRIDKLGERIKILEAGGTNRDKSQIDIEKRLDELEKQVSVLSEDWDE